jgi:hypothetical protein
LARDNRLVDGQLISIHREMPEFFPHGDFATAVADIAEQYNQPALVRRDDAETIAA